jgi:hypothetical protein
MYSLKSRLVEVSLFGCLYSNWTSSFRILKKNLDFVFLGSIRDSSREICVCKAIPIHRFPNNAGRNHGRRSQVILPFSGPIMDSLI